MARRAAESVVWLAVVQVLVLAPVLGFRLKSAD
jgi:hypothetical protein